MIIQCKCGCGAEFEEYDKKGRKRRFVPGHQSRCLSDATRQLMSIANSGENNPNYGKTPSDATRQLMSKSHIGKCCGENNPNYGKTHSPETRQLMSENRKDKYCGEDHYLYGKHRSKEYKAYLSEINSKEKNPNWKGGIAYEPYCQEFDKWLKEEIKERDGFECNNPDCIKEITKNNPLCTHHIDYDKKNCSTNNLITLCNSCNAKANSNREYWKEFYSNILMGNN